MRKTNNNFQTYQLNNKIDFVKLKEIIGFCKQNVPYYNEMLKDFRIKDINDFRKIPVLTQNNYLNNTPPKSHKLLSGPDSECFVFSTGGTTSEPRYVLRDFNDFENQHHDFVGLKVGKADTALNLFMPGFWGIFTSANLSLMQLGCKILPYGGANLDEKNKELLSNLIEKFNVNLLLGVPSTIFSLGNYLKSNSKNIARKKIDKIFCLGEKIYNSSIIDLKKTFSNAVLKSKYGCMESAGIGYQCKYLYGNNYHIYPDRFVEILPLSQEEKFSTNGLIVVTTLNKRLVPLLRYRTEDMGSIIRKKCQCGQELTLEVMGRQNDIFILASIHLSTDLIEKAIDRSEINTLNFNVEIKKMGNLDSAEIKIEVNQKEDPSVIKEITQKICKELFQEVPDLEEAILSKKLGYFRIRLVPVGSIQRMGLTGKMKRINDLRK